VDYIIAIDCPNSIQKKRLVGRDHISEQLAEQMIRGQMPNDVRCSRADIALDNRENGDLKSKVQEIHQSLLRMAKRYR
jgi:dephospho-CoA kinase